MVGWKNIPSGFCRRSFNILSTSTLWIRPCDCNCCHLIFIYFYYFFFAYSQIFSEGICIQLSISINVDGSKLKA